MPTFTRDDVEIAYSDTGVPAERPDAPTIVFGHGLLFSGWMFSAQIAALRDRYRCIAIDWRGQGDSPAAADGYDMDTLTDDAIALVESLDVAPVHWVGLSMGGFVGQRIAVRRPELLRSLTLVNTSAEQESFTDAVQYKAMARAYPLVGVRPLRRSIERKMLGPAFLADPGHTAAVDEWVEFLSRCDRRGIRKAVLGVANRPRYTDKVTSITAPTLVIGGEHDHALPPDQSRRLAALIPNARLEIVLGAGHSSTIERPAAVTALIEGFLADVDADLATGA